MPPPRQKKKQRAYADLSREHEDVTFDVFEPDDHARLDHFLAARIEWRSRTQIQRMIEAGEVLVDGVVARKPSHRVLRRGKVLVRIPRQGAADNSAPLVPLHEDAYLLALLKPAGIVCHPVGKTRTGTLVNALHARYRNPDPKLDIVPRLCHRLDKETSGIILVALQPGVRKRMQWVFESKQVVKQYLSIVEGEYPVDHEIVDLPIGKASGSAGHIRIARGVDLEGGDEAQTVVTVEERFPPCDGDRGHTLVRCSPITGRQHQIRIHALARGCPVLGDTMYGPLGLAWKGFPPAPAAPLLRRQALHAWRIQFPHPVTGAEMDIRAPLPADMAATLAWLRERRARSGGEVPSPRPTDWSAIGLREAAIPSGTGRDAGAPTARPRPAPAKKPKPRSAAPVERPAPARSPSRDEEE